MKQADWAAIAEYAGFGLTTAQIELLAIYRDWLQEEAIPAGGLGRAETSRLDDRHIADSLLFGVPFPDAPHEMADLGSGVGLPGIPLAIMLPDTKLTLIDRSGKRADLARRAVRVLDLSNVEVVQRDIASLDTGFATLVSRATLPPEELASHAKRLLVPGGMAVAGGSWIKSPRIDGWETREIPVEMLDRTVWLLIMRRQ